MTESSLFSIIKVKGHRESQTSKLDARDVMRPQFQGVTKGHNESQTIPKLRKYCGGGVTGSHKISKKLSEDDGAELNRGDKVTESHRKIIGHGRTRCCKVV